MYPSIIQSVKSEVHAQMLSDADFAAFEVGPPGAADSSFTFNDTYGVLPYSTVEITVHSGGAASGPNTAFQCNCFTSVGQTAAQAAVQVASQISAWARSYSALYPDMAGMRAFAIGDTVYIQMPWGMLLATPVDDTLWPPAVVVHDGLFGVDNPLVYGILGPRRHVFAWQQIYDRGYYYGSPD